MIYHLLHVSTYPEKFLRFLVKNKTSFNLEEHHFIIETNNYQLFGNEILSQIHYSLTKKGWGIYWALRNVGKRDKIIVHYLGNPRHLLLLSLFPRLARQMVWSVWGGDAYFPKMIKESWKYGCYEIMRKRVIPQIPWITCVVKGDYEFIMNNYDTRASYLYSVYPSDVNDEVFNRLCESCPEASGNVVLIGNSADPSNNHEQVLIALAAYKEKIAEILVPLMYGGSKDYVSSIIEQGERLFGEKFTPLTHFLPSEDYARILCQAKVLVLNHYRQQGLGNAFVVLALKRKVFIRSDITSYDYFRKIGIRIHDTIRLLQGVENLFDFDVEEGASNSKILREEVSEENLVKLWNQVFAINLWSAGIKRAG